VGFDGTEDALLGQLSSSELKDASVEEYPVLTYFDPKQRSLLQNLQGHNNDVKAVNLAKTADDRLVIEAEFFKPLRSPHEVLVHLKTIGADGGRPSTWRFVKRDGKFYFNNRPFSDGNFAHQVRQKTFWLSLPFEALGEPKALLIGVELMRKGTTVAKSAYRLVEIVPSPTRLPTLPAEGPWAESLR
jgi:hypothetical protein